MKRFLIFTLILSLLLPALSLAEQARLDLTDLTILDISDAQQVVLNGDSQVLSGSTVYALSGTISDGSLTVRADEGETVYVLLNGVTLNNSEGAALRTEGAGKVILTLCEGTDNSISQGASEPSESKNKAALYAEGDLTVNGTGTLTVSSQWKDGISCKGELRIISGTLNVTAQEDAIACKTGITISGGTVTATAQNGDALKATLDTDDEKGFVTVCGGSITLTAGGGAESVTYAEENPFAMTEKAEEENSTSLKGLKAKGTITVTAGTIVADTADDALHASDIEISGGILTLSSGDDAIHADQSLTISGGDITITRSYEGLEAAEITLSGGSVVLTAYDDGINGAGGEKGPEDTQQSRFPGGMLSESTGTLTMTGGTFTVLSEGDGVDVNGDITITGGTLLVRGAANSMNAALDYDGSLTMTGGTLIALGMSGMAQGVSSPSVPGAMITLNGEGTFSVSDENGTLLLTFDAEGTYNSAVVYSEEFTENAVYQYTSGEETQTFTASLEATTGMQMGMGFQGGFGRGFGGPRGGNGRWQESGEMPQMPEGMTPPEMPDGMAMPGLPEGMTPPELPEGMTMPEGMAPPEMPMDTANPQS